MSCPFHDVKGFLCALKGQFAHSPGQSEAAPWGFDTPVLLVRPVRAKALYTMM